MSEKIFKNRITQETPNTIKQLKSLWIDMNSDKQLTPNTPNGLSALMVIVATAFWYLQNLR